jgi:hypothetical protein
MKSKHAAGPASAASPFPQPEISTTLPAGKRGPVGLAPRTDYSRVNTGTPPVPDAGGSEQKSMAPRGVETLPKTASEDSMGQMAVRPTINEMVKNAMAGSLRAVEVTREASRQQSNIEPQTKTASASPSEPVSHATDLEKAEKLASALDYVASLVKQGFSLHENKVEPGKGPGHLEVLESPGGTNPFKPNSQGHGNTAQVGKGGAMGKATPAGPSTQMENDHVRAPGGPGRQPLAMVNQKHAAKECPKCGKEKCACDDGKVASIRAAWAKTAGVKTSSDPEKKETEGMREAEKGLAKAERAHASEPESKKVASFLGLADAMRSQVKVAEDAINPAHISAGAAVPPDTREAGQPGGVQPKGSGPSMIASAASATNYTKRQAKAEPKTDSNVYWKEPALSSSTDKTLNMAFKHTGEAGAKIASAGDPGVKTAAGRALLTKLAEAADAKKKAEQSAATTGA